MKAEYTAEDFAKAVKNPYFKQLNKRTEIAIRHEPYASFEEIGKKWCISRVYYKTVFRVLWTKIAGT